MGTSPEGEKLQSDSGVFLDSHSLQDNQPSKGATETGSPQFCFLTDNGYLYASELTFKVPMGARSSGEEDVNKV